MDSKKHSRDVSNWSGANLQPVIASIAEAITVTDPAGKITEVNTAAARLHGFNSSRDMTGMDVFELISANDRPKAQKDIKKMLKRGHSGHLEYTLLRKDGREFAAELSVTALKGNNGKVQGLIFLTWDITERRHAYEALSESEGKYRTLFEGRLYGTVVIDPTMKTVMVNKVGAEMFGFDSPREAAGVNIFDYIAPEERERTYRMIIEDMFGKGHREVHEFKAISRDGKEIWIHAEGVRIEYEGNIFGLISFRDITELKRAEVQLLGYQEELRSLASQLSLAEEQERRRIATEIHDRLTQTLALCSIKLGETLDSPACAGFARPLGQIQALIKQLIGEARSLTFKLSSPLLYEVGLEPALEHLTEQIQTEQGIECSFRDDGSSKPLHDDIRVTLFQAVRELLVNVGKHARASKTWINVGSQNGCIEIVVEDNGIGFETRRTDSDRKTLAGFGLFSIRERLRHLGGSLKVDSEPGRGTRATILAPLKGN